MRVSRHAPLLLAIVALAIPGAGAWAAPKFARTSGNWSTAANWSSVSCAVAGATTAPTAADDVTICNNITITVNVLGAQAGSVTIATGANASGLNFGAGTSLAVTSSGGLSGDLVINGPTNNVTKQVSVAAQTLTVDRDVIINGGTTTPNANNIAQLAVTTGTVSIGRNLVITGSTTVQSVARATLTTGKISVAGNATLTGGAATTQDALLTVSAAPAVAGNGIIIAGDLTVSATVATSSTVSITANNGVISVGGNVQNDDTVSIGGGIFTVTGNYTNSDAAIVAATSVSTGQLNITGNLTNGSIVANTGVDTITLSSTGTIKVDGTLTNNTNATTSGLITTTTTGTVNANGDFVNNGTFTHAAGGNLNLRGTNATMSGTFNRGSGTVTSNKLTAGTQNLAGTSLAFSNFVMNSANGVTLGANMTVNTALTLTSGVITTGAFAVAMVPNCAGGVTRTSGHVSGSFRKPIPAGASACTWQVGGASSYAPITATFVAGTVAASITATSTDGDHPSVDTSGLDPSLTANRYWSLTSSVAQGTAFSAVFNFVAGDLDTDTQSATNFVSRRFSGAAWTTPTTGARTATSTQMTGLTLAANTQADYAVGEAERAAGTGSFNAVENGASATAGKIFTKLAGTAFVLDLVALNAARTAIDTTFKGAVKVELLDSSSGGALDANGCNAGWTIIQALVANPQFLVADAGRKQNVSFTEANAWPNVRVRVTSPATGAAVLIGCSSDNFSIRPTAFTGVVGGAPLVMNNAGTSGSPRAIAGSGTFTLIAATGLTGYTGTPKVDNTAVQAHAGAMGNGTVSGNFPAAVSGTSNGTSAFTYSEVGNFKFLGSAATAGSTAARGVYDDTFTAVDGATDCTADFSNVLSGGKYGCKFGLTADSGFFGRFYPANFVLSATSLTNRRLSSCSPASTFTYAGEQFRVTFTLTAKNGAGSPATTLNYDPGAGFAAFNAGAIANFNFGAIDLADATPPLTATALTSSLALLSSTGTWASGTVNVAADLSLNRAAAPNGPFESFNLGIDPIDPTDNDVKLNTYNLDTSVPSDGNDRGLVGATRIRFGQLRLQAATGASRQHGAAPFLELAVPARVEYWNGSVFTANTADSCTTLDRSNIVLSGYQKSLNACESMINRGGSATVSFVSGTSTLRLSAPGAGNEGSVLLTPQLGAAVGGNYCAAIGATDTPAASAAQSYLQGAWTGANYDQNPSARAAFGVYGAQPGGFIFYRENY